MRDDVRGVGTAYTEGFFFSFFSFFSFFFFYHHPFEDIALLSDGEVRRRKELHVCGLAICVYLCIALWYGRPGWRTRPRRHLQGWRVTWGKDEDGKDEVCLPPYAGLSMYVLLCRIPTVSDSRFLARSLSLLLLLLPTTTHDEMLMVQPPCGGHYRATYACSWRPGMMGQSVQSARVFTTGTCCSESTPYFLDATSPIHVTIACG
ncbi:hypothetical protein VTN02DRAFT_2919 [Thermoascus thermophilus]